MVVGHHGEFVGGEVVASPDHEVAEVDAGRAGNGALQGVVKLDDASVGHAESPRHATGGRGPLAVRWPQRRRKRCLPPNLGNLGGLVRGVGGLFDVAAGMRARIDRSGCLEAAPHLQKPVRPFALHIRAMRAAHVGALGPFESEPVEVFERGGGELGPAAGAVEILDAKHESGPAGPIGGDGERSRVPRVEISGGCRGDASPASHAYSSHQAPVAST